jgi:hypothetical protein
MKLKISYAHTLHSKDSGCNKKSHQLAAAIMGIEVGPSFNRLENCILLMSVSKINIEHVFFNANVLVRNVRMSKLFHAVNR